MNFIIRSIKPHESDCILKDFLYEAIFVPKGIEPPSKDIINHPDLRIYYENFGTRFGDVGLVAELDNKIVGAAWSRIIKDYGHIDDETPSLSMSLYADYRARGIGTKLLHSLLDELEKEGFKQVSLSVQKENYAVSMYEQSGFEVFKENDTDLVMKLMLNNR